jgi:DNA-binding transcriptional regulator YdaS (Cro superfamily)
MTNGVNVLTEQEVYKRFLQSVEDAGGQRRWAEAHGVTPAYVNDMVNRRRKLSVRVLAMIGIEMEVTTIYREKRSV